jgi:hypothetical protein
MPTGSALPLVRLPGFEYPANAKLDFGPLERGIQQYTGSQLKIAELERQDERMRFDRDKWLQEFGLNQRRVDIDERLRTSAEGRDQERLRLLQSADRRAGEEAERRERNEAAIRTANRAWEIRRNPDRTFRSRDSIDLIFNTPNLSSALERSGVRLNRETSTVEDYDRALDFIISQVPDARTRYYGSQANIDALRERSEARGHDAETRRLRLLYEQFTERLGANPTREQWERENVPGGIVHTVFGGPRNFEDAPSLIQQVQERRRRTNLPDEDELRGLGYNEAQIRALRRLSVERRLGLVSPPGPGNRYEITAEGERRIVRGEGRDVDPRNPVTPEAMQVQVRRLDQVFSLLAGTARQDGTLDTSHAIPLTERVAGHWWGGQYISPRAYEAFESARHAALQLTYALSGRQIGQAEQGRILEMYTPRAGDTHEVAGFRINAMRQMYRQLLAARGRPLTQSERAEFEDQLAYHARTVERLRREAEEARSGRRRTPETQPPPGRVPPTNPDVRGLSDEELRRRLGINP